MEATGAAIFRTRSAIPAAAGRDARVPFVAARRPRRASVSLVVAALENGASASDSVSKKSASGGGGGRVPNSNYVVPFDLTPSFCRPLKEILRDLNKKVPDNIINADDNSIPWYHANRMLSFYAPGWCGEVRDVIFSDNGNVTVVYRVTIRGLDGEAHRESTGTVSSSDGQFEDPIAAAEEVAFCKACARFGFGLHLYHENEAV
ncbi:DNA repair RAD52-like protein 2, chloroplastic [Musa acuminata AAA Group]|uniref:DNA repair RAD52-like protein 2, chloroplastic n=1 Tax=Musa acuminata AAA Group TaxID=214697 RepID=UPI0031DFD1C5